MTLPAPVPSLDELAAQPAKVRELSPDAAFTLAVRVGALAIALQIRAASDGGRAESSEPAEDRLLDAEEAARLLGCSRGRLYKRVRAGAYPFAIRDGGRLRFSAAGLQAYIRRPRRVP